MRPNSARNWRQKPHGGTGSGESDTIATRVKQVISRRIEGASDISVRLWAGGPPLKGRLREVSPVADAATRTFSALPGNDQVGVTQVRVYASDADGAVYLQGTQYSVDFLKNAPRAFVDRYLAG